jgi:acyl carrier protein
MFDHTALCSQIDRLFLENFSIQVPSYQLDLIDTGFMTSLIFLDLLAQLERQFAITVSLEDMEIDDFRSIEKIGQYVERRSLFPVVWTETRSMG